MRALVEERATLVRALSDVTPAHGALPLRPQSRDQHAVYAAGPSSGKSFVEAIT